MFRFDAISNSAEGIQSYFDLNWTMLYFLSRELWYGNCLRECIYICSRNALCICAACVPYNKIQMKKILFSNKREQNLPTIDISIQYNYIREKKRKKKQWRGGKDNAMWSINHNSRSAISSMISHFFLLHSNNKFWRWWREETGLRWKHEFYWQKPVSKALRIKL